MIRQRMTDAELRRLRVELDALIRGGATIDEIEEWADAYAFTRADLINLYQLVLGSLPE